MDCFMAKQGVCPTWQIQKPQKGKYLTGQLQPFWRKKKKQPFPQTHFYFLTTKTLAFLVVVAFHFVCKLWECKLRFSSSVIFAHSSFFHLQIRWCQCPQQQQYTSKKECGSLSAVTNVAEKGSATCQTFGFRFPHIVDIKLQWSLWYEPKQKAALLYEDCSSLCLWTWAGLR